MGFFRSSGRFMSAKSKEASAAASKEANSSVAHNRNAPADARLRAGFRGIGDRFKEHKHRNAASTHKHAAKHNY